MEAVCIRSAARVSCASVRRGYSMPSMGLASTKRPTEQGRPIMRASFMPRRDIFCTLDLSLRATLADMAGTRLMARAMVSTPGMLVSVVTLERSRE